MSKRPGIVLKSPTTEQQIKTEGSKADVSTDTKTKGSVGSFSYINVGKRLRKIVTKAEQTQSSDRRGSYPIGGLNAIPKGLNHFLLDSSKKEPNLPAIKNEHQSTSYPNHLPNLNLPKIIAHQLFVKKNLFFLPKNGPAPPVTQHIPPTTENKPDCDDGYDSFDEHFKGVDWDLYFPKPSGSVPTSKPPSNEQTFQNGGYFPIYWSLSPSPGCIPCYCTQKLMTNNSHSGGDPKEHFSKARSRMTNNPHSGLDLKERFSKAASNCVDDDNSTDSE